MRSLSVSSLCFFVVLAEFLPAVLPGETCVFTVNKVFYPDPAPELVHTLCAREPQGPLLNLLAGKQDGTQDLTLGGGSLLKKLVYLTGHILYV